MDNPGHTGLGRVIRRCERIDVSLVTCPARSFLGRGRELDQRRRSSTCTGDCCRSSATWAIPRLPGGEAGHAAVDLHRAGKGRATVLVLELPARRRLRARCRRSTTAERWMPTWFGNTCTARSGPGFRRRCSATHGGCVTRLPRTRRGSNVNWRSNPQWINEQLKHMASVGDLFEGPDHAAG